MAGRTLPGIGQLTLAVIGFVLVIVWFALTLTQVYELTDFSREITGKSYVRFGVSGAVVFGASWFWALATSISLLREAKKNNVPLQTPIPPRVAGPAPDKTDPPG